MEKRLAAVDKRAKGNVIELNKFRVRKEMLTGEVKSIQGALEKEVYYELIEEIKEEAMDLFRDVATTHYMDTRCELKELDSIMIDLKDYEIFYNEILDDYTKQEIEEEIMEELAQELKYDSDYVIGYNWGHPVMIMCMQYFIDEIEDYKDDEEYENIGFYSNSIVI